MSISEEIQGLDQLEQYFKDGFTPRSNWKTGLECELFAVNKDTLKSVPYTGSNGVEGILTDLAEKCSWQPVIDEGKILGLKKGGSNITLEPGGQIELSGMPTQKTQEGIDEYYRFVRDLLSVCNPKDILLLPIGYQPMCSLDDIEWLPKSRYAIMSKYFSDKGKLAHHMMKLTSTVQINLDYSSEEDFNEKFRLSSYLAPVLQSIYSYSPFKLGNINGYLDFRGHIWEHVDNDRCGIIKGSFREDFSFKDYANLILDMPMVLLIDNDGVSIPMYGETMRAYMEREKVYMEDFANHLSFGFFETRLKQRHLEIRVIDSQHPKLIPSIPSVVKGLFYHDQTRKDLLDYFSRWSGETIIDLHYRAHKTALHTEFNDGFLMDICHNVFNSAKKALKELVKDGVFADETDLVNLEPLEELLIQQKKCPAEIIIEEWEKNNQDLYRLKNLLTIQEL